MDSLIQSQEPKETVQLTPHNPYNVPCVCGVQNGHTDHKRGNGSTLLGKPTKPLVNGISCTCQVRQMLLSNPSLVTHPVHVGDIMGYSFPVLLMDENNQVSARTRGSHCTPKRKLVRVKKKDSTRERKVNNEGCDLVDTYHSFLSQPEGTSNIK